MQHSEKVKAIKFIRPGAEFVLSGDNLQWLDKSQTQPTDEEIEAGLIAYEAKVEIDKTQAETKRQALLNRLGITADEARLLLG